MKLGNLVQGAFQREMGMCKMTCLQTPYGTGSDMVMFSHY